jgi:hypothetical protein
MNRRRLSISAFAIFLMSVGGSPGCGGAPAESHGSAASSGTGAAGGSAASGGTGGGSGTGSAGGGGAGAGGGTGGASSTSSTGSGAATGTGGAGGLSPGAPPGVNFDLSLWELQEPVGSPGSPVTISPAMLAGGFHDAYFYTDPVDGAMTFWDPENGVTTPNSNYPRSELRELKAGGSGANWAVAGTNTLSATVAVVKVPDHVCIGQIHIGTAIQPGLPASTKPLLELYYHSTGSLVLGIEDSPAGGQTAHTITTIPLGTKFSYSIELRGDGTITLGVNGVPSKFPMPASFNGYGMYFKAGNYDQTVGNDGTIGAIVKFYALQVSHGP